MKLDVETVTRLYHHEGKSLRETGMVLGHTGKEVGRFMEQQGIPRRQRGRDVAPGVTVSMRRAGRRAEQDLIRLGVMVRS